MFKHSAVCSLKMFRICLTKCIIYIYCLPFIPNIAAIKVLTSPAIGQSSVPIPGSDVSGLDAFTVCFRVFSHQFNKNFNPLITIPTSDGSNNPINFGTVATPCHYASGKGLL